MDTTPKYMTPLEAEETMKRLWVNEAALLTHLYAAEVRLGNSGMEQPYHSPNV
jgi:hypothetical protein